MNAYSSRDIIAILKADGWYLVKVRGDHYQLKHPLKKNKVTVPHPVKDLPIGTLKSIAKQSEIEL
jgi:predicted RNA binding protein YcfA (HicA-like mRNA interferase family)